MQTLAGRAQFGRVASGETLFGEDRTVVTERGLDPPSTPPGEM